jgi:hypothetical protein
MIDTDRLEQVIRDSIERLCKELFPHGVREGNEWKIADVTGAKGDSLGICLSREKAGVFYDHATGDKGRFTDLVKASRNLSFPDAVGVIEKCLGINLQAVGTNGETPLSWNSLEKLNPSYQDRLAKWRGFTPEAVNRFVNSDLIRIFTDKGGVKHWTFPVFVGGHIKGFHYRPVAAQEGQKDLWRVYPCSKAGGPGTRPFIIGDQKAPTTVHLTESTWDALGLCDKLSIDEVDAACVFCTKGAGNSRLVSSLPSSVVRIFAWPQNDGPGQKWLSDVARELRSSIEVVPTPSEHSDLNDWLKAGATSDDLLAAMKGAKIIKPSPLNDEESPQFSKGVQQDYGDSGSETNTGAEPPTNGEKPQLILPCPKFEITKSAKQCFTVLAKTHRYFTRDRTVFEVVWDEENDGLRLIELEPAAFRSHLEHHFRLVTLRTPSGGGQTFLIENRCSLDNAIALLKSDEAFELLPRIKIVTAAAVFVEIDGKIEVLNEGYHNVKGGILITKKREITDVDLGVAVKALIDLLHDFEFVSPADGSRALAGFLSPALRLGGLLVGDFPLDLSEANESQSGKTYRQKVNCALYGEEPFVLNKNEDAGVGSLDERVSDALISGKPFLMLENVRGPIRSQLLESALRGAGSVQARRAYSRSVQVKPDRICWALSSNKAETTGDLANRSIITRIVRQPAGYQFKIFPEGDLLQHVRANSDYCLSCVLSVVREWYSKGKSRTTDTRHDFREWCQSLDWIVQNIFHCAPLLDGHRNEQLRTSNPDLNWLREVGLCAEKDKRDSEGLKAAEIVSLCEAHGVDIPRCHASADDTKRRMTVGIILKRLFAEDNEIEVGGYLIRRESRDEWNLERREKMIANYHFFERPQTARAAPIQK